MWQGSVASMGSSMAPPQEPASSSMPTCTSSPAKKLHVAHSSTGSSRARKHGLRKACHMACRAACTVSSCVASSHAERLLKNLLRACDLRLPLPLLHSQCAAVKHGQDMATSAWVVCGARRIPLFGPCPFRNLVKRRGPCLVNRL